MERGREHGDPFFHIWGKLFGSHEQRLGGETQREGFAVTVNNLSTTGRQDKPPLMLNCRLTREFIALHYSQLYESK
jgi:hypothetical protein